MTIIDIYHKYQIIPILQLHQLRVAAVGKTIASQFDQVDSHIITQVCLLHDMGNILKIDFDSMFSQKTLDENQRKQGKLIKTTFEKKYGENEHDATLAIIKEIGIEPQVSQIVEAMCFTKIESDDFLRAPLEHQICEYADMRVDPYGVVSLEQRLADLENRYKDRYSTLEHQQNRQKFAQLMRQVEANILNQINLSAQMLNNERLNDTIESLKLFEF